jgi:hypothetical protein
MITDGVKGENKQDDVKVLDIAELVAQANSLLIKEMRLEK